MPQLLALFMFETYVGLEIVFWLSLELFSLLGLV